MVRGSHIHCRPIQVGKGRVSDAVVSVGGGPLKAKDVWLAKQFQQNAVFKPTPAWEVPGLATDAQARLTSDLAMCMHVTSHNCR